MRIKHAFTMLEMVIALAILSMIGTVVGWQIHSMIASHRFHSGVDRFCIAVQEAQLLAITHQTDFTIRLFKEKNQCWYQIETLEPLSIVDQAPKEFFGVDHLTEQGIKKEEIRLNLYATGRIEPPHVIGLHQRTAEEEVLWIDLQTPIRIKLASKKPEPLRTQLPALPKQR